MQGAYLAISMCFAIFLRELEYASPLVDAYLKAADKTLSRRAALIKQRKLDYRCQLFGFPLFNEIAGSRLATPYSTLPVETVSPPERGGIKDLKYTSLRILLYHILGRMQPVHSFARHRD